MTTIAETIEGKNVSLQADNNVNLLAGTNTTKITEDNKNTGWSVGTSIGLASGSLMGLDASAYKATEHGVTDMTTHTGTTVTGADSVSISSGQDTNITGSKVKGNTVAVNVGKDLNMTSLQDTKKYTNWSNNSGMKLSTDFTAIGTNIGFSNAKGEMDSTYASVTDQAGIYAGNGGFTVNTKGTTTLTGAVIDSTLTGKAANDKNTLTTSKLVMKDVENTAEYSTSNKGLAYNYFGDYKERSDAEKNKVYNEKGLIPVLMPGSSDSASSVTKSAIGEATVKVADKAFDIAKLERDTTHSLQKLDEIFDKEKIEERQELARLVAKEANTQLHNWKPTSKDGKLAKSLTHGVVAEIVTRIGGNSAGSGFTAGMTNEAMLLNIKQIAKLDPDVAQWLSATVGGLVNKGIGKPVNAGAAVAQCGTKWNEKNTVGYEGESRRKILYEADGTITAVDGVTLIATGYDSDGYEILYFSDNTSSYTGNLVNVMGVGYGSESKTKIEYMEDGSSRAVSGVFLQATGYDTAGNEIYYYTDGSTAYSGNKVKLEDKKTNYNHIKGLDFLAINEGNFDENKVSIKKGFEAMGIRWTNDKYSTDVRTAAVDMSVHGGFTWDKGLNLGATGAWENITVDYKGEYGSIGGGILRVEGSRDLYFGKNGKYGFSNIGKLYAAEIHSSMKQKIGRFTIEEYGEVGIGVAGGTKATWEGNNVSVGVYGTSPIGIAGGAELKITAEKKEGDNKKLSGYRFMN